MSNHRWNILFCLTTLALLASSDRVAHAGWLQADDVPGLTELRVDVVASAPIAPWVSDVPDNSDVLTPSSGAASPRVQTVESSTFACSALLDPTVGDDAKQGEICAEFPVATGIGTWDDVFRPPRDGNGQTAQTSPFLIPR